MNTTNSKDRTLVDSGATVTSSVLLAGPKKNPSDAEKSSVLA